MNFYFIENEDVQNASMKETCMNSEEVNTSNEGWKTVDQNNEVVQNVWKESMNDKSISNEKADTSNNEGNFGNIDKCVKIYVYI